MHEKKKQFVVLEDAKLIDLLTENLKGLSKSKIKSLLKYENVFVEENVETNANKTILKNSNICIYFEKRKLTKFNLKILYEDKDLIAIDKPSGLLSISSSKENEITAYKLVSDYEKEKNPKNKIFVVHRLDQDTSGVLLFSKNLKLRDFMQDNWNSIVKSREYICVVYGKTLLHGRFESYLTSDSFQKVYSTSNKKKGKFAITNYEMINYKNGFSLLKVLINTGRKNQIRVHLSEAGHTIVGDRKYGAKTNPINRLALHASELSLVDPRTKKILKIKSDVPQNILDLVK